MVENGLIDVRSSSPKLPALAFQTMSNILKQAQFLVLIIFLPIASLGDNSDSVVCDEQCTCVPISQNENDFVVSCLNLTYIPTNIPSATNELLLSHSNIGSFTLANLSHFTYLKKMVLNHCNITEFISTTVVSSQFRYLEILDLSYNQMTRIPPYLTSSIRTLLLSHNFISAVDYQQSLHHLMNLKELFLDHNHLNSVSISTFHGAGSHTGLTSLEKLALNANQISLIESNAFSGLNFLSALTLADNALIQLEGDLFLGLKNIRHLDISHNQLSHIASDAFYDLPQLKYLNLNHNTIKIFPRMPPLVEWLDLSNNLMQGITERFKPDIYPIEVLNIAQNPFRCDCQLKWLKQLYERRQYLLKHIDLDPNQFVPMCASPPILAGKDWSEISDDLFKCSDDDPSASLDPILNAENLEISTRVGLVTDTSLQVIWTSNSPGSSLANILIQYYAFGLRDATMKHVEVAAAQQNYVIKNLRPSTNYVICIRPKKSTHGQALNTPLSLNDCKEIVTKEPKPPPLASRVEVFFYYILGMLATFIGIFVSIGVFAMIYGLWTSKNNQWSSKFVAEDSRIEDTTYQTDEPITKDKKPHKD